MQNPVVADFFESLVERGYEPLLDDTSGTLRWDLAKEDLVEQWFVELDQGNIRVSHSGSNADVVISVDNELFERLVKGEANAQASALRGLIVPDGDLVLARLFQRLFPGPPDSRREPATVGGQSND